MKKLLFLVSIICSYSVVACETTILTTVIKTCLTNEDKKYLNQSFTNFLIEESWSRTQLKRQLVSTIRGNYHKNKIKRYEGSGNTTPFLLMDAAIKSKKKRFLFELLRYYDHFELYSLAFALNLEYKSVSIDEFSKVTGFSLLELFSSFSSRVNFNVLTDKQIASFAYELINEKKLKSKKNNVYSSHSFEKTLEKLPKGILKSRDSISENLYRNKLYSVLFSFLKNQEGLSKYEVSLLKRSIIHIDQSHQLKEYSVSQDDIVGDNAETALEYAWVNKKYNSYLHLTENVFKKLKIKQVDKAFSNSSLSHKYQELSKKELNHKTYKEMYAFVKIVEEEVAENRSLLIGDRNMLITFLKKNKKTTERYYNALKNEKYVLSSKGAEVKIDFEESVGGLIRPPGAVVMIQKNIKNEKVIVDNLLCLDRDFRKLQIINVTGFDKVPRTDNANEKNLIAYTNSETIKEDMTCVFAVNLDKKVNLKYPFQYLEPTKELGRRYLMGKPLEDHGDEYYTKDRYESEKKIKTALSSFSFNGIDYVLFRGGEDHSYFIIASSYDVTEGLRRINLTKSFCDTNSSNEFECYSITRIQSLGDFNGDGLLDILLSPGIDSKHSFNVLILSNKKKGEYERINLDMGGC